jgi:hypothetical protein
MARTMIRQRRSDGIIESYGYFPAEGTDDQFIIRLLDDDQTAQFMALVGQSGHVKLLPNDTFELIEPDEDAPDPIRQLQAQHEARADRLRQLLADPSLTDAQREIMAAVVDTVTGGVHDLSGNAQGRSGA